MTLNELILEIRLRLGNPSEVELGFDTVRFSIEAALGELSRVQPLYSYNAIDLSKDVEEYDVADGIIDVVGFWFTPELTKSVFQSVFDVIGEDVPMPGHFTVDNMHTFHSPSMMNVFEEKMERMRIRREYSWEFNADFGKLLIIPAPSINGKGVYKGKSKRTLEAVPEKYVDAFKDLARAETMNSYASSQSQIQAMPVGVGTVMYDTKSLKDEALSLKKEALGKLTSAGSVVISR